MKTLIALAFGAMGAWFMFWPPFQPTNAQLFGFECVIMIWVIGNRQYIQDHLVK